MTDHQFQLLLRHLQVIIATSMPSRGWPAHPNLRFRPQYPNKGRGRVQQSVRRAFVAAGTSALTTSDVFDYALVRVRGEGWRRRHRWSVVRALRQMCDRVRKVPPHGAWLWRLRDGELK